MNSAHSSIKFFFKTKIKCERFNNVSLNLTEVEYKFVKVDYMAFDKKILWFDWDQVNQEFRYKFPIKYYGKEKIVAMNGKSKVISIDRISGEGFSYAFGIDKYKNCREIKNLPKMKIKQKF